MCIEIDMDEVRMGYKKSEATFFFTHNYECELFQSCKGHIMQIIWDQVADGVYVLIDGETRHRFSVDDFKLIIKLAKTIDGLVENDEVKS